MAAAITIPISTFELAIAYERPEVRLLADRAPIVQALFARLAPWNPSIDDMEVLTAGKPSEQGVKIKIPSRNASFFFGASSCRFTKDTANWSEADEILKLLTALLDTLVATGGVKFGKRAAIVTLHLQPKTVSSKDILRRLIVPHILKLESAPTEAMAVVTRWPNRRITIDGSAALANGIFLQMEREFDASLSFDEMKKAILSDESELFELLDIEEVES
jgi:hypothetical protein